MTKNTSKLFMLILATTFLASCGGGVSSGLDPSSSEPPYSENGEMDPSEFILPSKKVTTTKLVTYDAPEPLTPSSKVSLTVEGEDVFVYETRVNHARSFTFAYPTTTAPVAIFDFEGRVHLEVEVLEGGVESALVRPLAYAIKPKISGNKITFTLDYSGNYTLEWNGDEKTAFHIFANGIEEDPIDPNNVPAGVTYLGPGLYDADAIPLASNETIYLAGGAVVFGQIRAEGMDNIKIRGRGILHGEIYDRLSENQFTLPIQLRNSTNVLIEDIAILDPAGWAITIYFCDDVVINNVKIITARANGDGISLQSSKNVTVTGGFIRAWDDALVVKNVNRGSTSDILCDNVVIWTDLAQSMEIGYETYGPLMENITFRNITIIHNFHKPAMSIHNCDDADIKNVTFENITLEDGQMFGDNRNDGLDDYLIDITIAYNIEWTKSGAARGSIDGVTFKNIKTSPLADSIISRINGEDTASDVKNVTFENIYIGDKAVSKASDLKLVSNNFVSKVTFAGSNKKLGAVISLPYQLNLANELVEKENIKGIAQKGLIVPSFAHSKGELPFSGIASSGVFTASSSHGVGVRPIDPVSDGTGVYEVAGHEASKIIDKNFESTWKSPAWRDEENEFAAIQIEFDEAKYIGQLRIHGDKENVYSYEYSLQVFGRRLDSNGVASSSYVRIRSMAEYSMSPRSGNAIDINITAQNYVGIQIRIFRTEGYLTPPQIAISEVEFFAPSLTFNKSIVSSTPHADVYDISKINDGDTTGTSYYESASLPAHVVIDMAEVYAISTIVISLSSSLLWDARIQNIEIAVNGSNAAYSDKMVFTTIVEPADFLFDPMTGNRVVIELDQPIDARYFKIMINSNSAVGGYGAQVSELSVYGK